MDPMTHPIDLDQIKHRIRTFIAQSMLFSEDGFAYSDDDSFLQQGIIDSLGVMQLVEFVQNDLKVLVEDQEVTPANFDSVNKLSSFVEGKLRTQALSGAK
jgi:acyl carrier protein